MSQRGRWLFILLTASSLACSPALNWREARFDGTVPLRLLLPCKPDRAERQVEMGQRAVALQMLGCDADGATFAVSHVQVPNAAEAGALLVGWKSAVLAHVQAQSVQEQPWTPAGGWPSQQSQRVVASGRRADGQAMVLQAAWFGFASPAGIHLFHGVMFSPQPRPDVAETFFSGFASAP